MNDLQINALNHFLHNGVVEVNFTKTNGDLRRMNCTLVPEYMHTKPSEDGARKSNPAVAAVWDLDKDGWRSFRYDSVKSVVVDGREVSYG